MSGERTDHSPSHNTSDRGEAGSGASISGAADRGPSVHEANTAAEWERHAAWWQDGFTDGADSEYVEQIIPLVAQWLPAAATVLDIGAGDGQIARMAAANGHVSIAVERSESQIAVGCERDAANAGVAAVRWVRGDAVRLPLADDSVDAAVLCLVIEHIEDFEAAFAEVARVLRPGGRMLVLMNHPILQTPNSGWIDDHILEEQYWRIGPYLVETTTSEEVGRDVSLTFHHRPLGRYLNAAADLGLNLTAFIEPAPPSGFLAETPEYSDADTIPRLLLTVHTLAGGR
ncbi:MAG TPA: class I SAM-dependent methyltransferase [Microthrixaceae bacterium]|nr:class I SAM-dependent methyltransferase [Microthrixaceae bacterium]